MRRARWQDHNTLPRRIPIHAWWGQWDSNPRWSFDTGLKVPPNRRYGDTPEKPRKPFHIGATPCSLADHTFELSVTEGSIPATRLLRADVCNHRDGFLLAPHTGFEPVVFSVTGRYPFQTGPMEHGGRGGNRTPRGRSHRIYSPAALTSIALAHEAHEKPKLPVGPCCLAMPKRGLVMVWIVSSTSTLPMRLGVGAHHPRLSRVSIRDESEPLHFCIAKRGYYESNAVSRGVGSRCRPIWPYPLGSTSLCLRTKKGHLDFSW